MSLKDGGSQNGYLLAMTDGNRLKLSSIAWLSKLIKRVVKSLLAVETFSLVEVVETCFWMQNTSGEIFGQQNIYDIESIRY